MKRETAVAPAGSVSAEDRSELEGPDHPKPRVIFIVGWGRSGSTLLGNTLGELQGCVHVGEIHDLWSAYAARFVCGCGRPLPDCPFWAQVAAGDPAVGHALQSASEVAQTKRRHVRVRYVPKILRDRAPGSSSPLEEYSELAAHLFRAVAKAANAETVIDSTKSPAAAALLVRMPLQASFIHLVRDPRATGFSWQRHVLSDPGGTRAMARRAYGYNAASWLYWNLVAESIRRHVDPGHWLRLRYEDFVASPEEALRRIVEKFRLPTTGWPLQGRMLQLGTHHTVEGNPSRFGTGLREVKIDDQWLTRMPRAARALTVAITAPLFISYGYHRLRNSVSSSDDETVD